jgi:hypothetical protein
VVAGRAAEHAGCRDQSTPFGVWVKEKRLSGRAGRLASKGRWMASSPPTGRLIAPAAITSETVRRVSRDQERRSNQRKAAVWNFSRRPIDTRSQEREPHAQRRHQSMRRTARKERFNMHPRPRHDDHHGARLTDVEVGQPEVPSDTQPCGSVPSPTMISRITRSTSKTRLNVKDDDA